MINEYTKFDVTNDNRQTLPRFQPEAIRANYRIVEVLNAFGRTRGITPAQIALAWLMNKKPFIVPIRAPPNSLIWKRTFVPATSVSRQKR